MHRNELCAGCLGLAHCGWPCGPALPSPWAWCGHGTLGMGAAGWRRVLHLVVQRPACTSGVPGTPFPWDVPCGYALFFDRNLLWACLGSLSPPGRGWPHASFLLCWCAPSCLSGNVRCLGLLLTRGIVNWLVHFVDCVALRSRASSLYPCGIALVCCTLCSLTLLDYDFAVGGTSPGDPTDGVTAVHLLCKPHRAAAEEAKERPAKGAGCCCSLM